MTSCRTSSRFASFCAEDLRGSIREAAKRVQNDMTAGQELGLPAAVQLRGILKALRIILGTPEGESVLNHAVTVARHARMYNALVNEPGPSAAE